MSSSQKIARVGLVCEGPTDETVVKAIIETILPTSMFSVTLQQPEFSAAFGDYRGEHGTGWRGVLQWCKASKRDFGELVDNPLFMNFDVLIIHLDADVAEEHDIELAQPCPLASATTDRLRIFLAELAGVATPTGNVVFCTPSKATEAWLLAALYPSENYRGQDIECLSDPASRLAGKPEGERLVSGRKKLPKRYESRKQDISAGWPQACAACSEASRFDADLRRALA